MIRIHYNITKTKYIVVDKMDMNSKDFFTTNE